MSLRHSTRNTRQHTQHNTGTYLEDMVASLEMRASRNGDVPAEVVSMLLTLASTVDEAVPEGTSTSVTTLMELVVVTFLMNRLLCIETHHTMGEGEMATTHSHSHTHTATPTQLHSNVRNVNTEQRGNLREVCGAQGVHEIFRRQRAVQHGLEQHVGTRSARSHVRAEV